MSFLKKQFHKKSLTKSGFLKRIHPEFVLRGIVYWQGWAKCSKTQRLGRYNKKDFLKKYLANKGILLCNRWNSKELYGTPKHKKKLFD